MLMLEPPSPCCYLMEAQAGAEQVRCHWVREGYDVRGRWLGYAYMNTCAQRPREMNITLPVCCGSMVLHLLHSHQPVPPISLTHLSFPLFCPVQHHFVLVAHWETGAHLSLRQDLISILWSKQAQGWLQQRDRGFSSTKVRQLHNHYFQSSLEYPPKNITENWTPAMWCVREGVGSAGCHCMTF